MTNKKHNRNTKQNKDTDTAQTIEVVQDAGMLSDDDLSNRFAELLLEFYRAFFGSDDVTPKMITKESSINTWHACMTYIYKHLIRGTNIKSPAYADNAPRNSYDLDAIDHLADIYIYFCKAYNKPQSALAFADLVGISDETISQWGNREYADGLTAKRRRLWKKITGARREAITNRVLDGGAATIGAVTLYNNEVLPQKTAETEPQNNYSALPDLSSSLLLDSNGD